MCSVLIVSSKRNEPRENLILIWRWCQIDLFQIFSILMIINTMLLSEIFKVFINSFYSPCFWHEQAGVKLPHETAVSLISQILQFRDSLVVLEVLAKKNNIISLGLLVLLVLLVGGRDSARDNACVGRSRQTSASFLYICQDWMYIVLSHLASRRE